MNILYFIQFNLLENLIASNVFVLIGFVFRRQNKSKRNYTQFDLRICVSNWDC